MCTSVFVIATSVVFGIGLLIIMRYMIRLGYDNPEIKKRHMMITLITLLVVIACLGLHMASSCPTYFVTWGAVETALLNYLFLVECCRISCRH